MTGLLVKSIIIALVVGLVGGYAVTWLGQLLTSVLKTDIRVLPTAVVAVFTLVLVVYAFREAQKLLGASFGGEKNKE